MSGRWPIGLIAVLVLSAAGCAAVRPAPAGTSVLPATPEPIFTDGARTVVFSGPSRTFAEPATTTAAITTDAWVRIAPVPWHPGAEREPEFAAWLTHAREDHGPDLLTIALQYIDAAPGETDAAGRRIAGDATYGPRNGPGAADRSENSDFNDYLGIDWPYPDGTVRKAAADRLGALDCSGYVRMVYGYRNGFPLKWTARAPSGVLPRRAIMMSTYDVGVTVIPDTGAQATDVTPLQAGDLVFFDTDPGDGPAVDHVGIYLGADSAGRPRFLSSRKTANGPTLGDLGGTSVLTGGGLYARAFRAAKRL